MPEPKKKSPGTPAAGKKPAANQDYQQLLAAAEALLRRVKTMEGMANGEMRKMTKKITDLMAE